MKTLFRSAVLVLMLLCVVGAPWLNAQEEEFVGQFEVVPERKSDPG